MVCALHLWRGVLKHVIGLALEWLWPVYGEQCHGASLWLLLFQQGPCEQFLWNFLGPVCVGESIFPGLGEEVGQVLVEWHAQPPAHFIASSVD